MAVRTKTFIGHERTYYYLHRHMAHFEKSDAMALFESQKKQGYLIAKQRYMKKYLENISGVNDSALSMLNASMKEEEIINNLDSAFLEVLNNKVSDAIKGYNFEEYVGKAYAALDEYYKTKDLKALDEIFAQITEAAKLLNTDISTLTFLIGRRGQFKKGGRDLGKLYDLINKEMKKFEGKTLNVSQERLVSVLGSLKRFVGSADFAKNNKMQMQRYLANIFSTQIGEYIISKGVAQGFDKCLKDIRSSMVGSKKIKKAELQTSPELENFIKQYGQRRSQSFKTDNSFKNLSITIEDGSTFEVNLGVSAKWYKGLADSSNDNVSITNETSFTHRLNQMINGDLERYYAYNALSLAGEDNSVYKALKAAILARNMDIFISGIGLKGDFSQYMVINGEFYSIWQIINLIENYNSGQGSSGIDPGATDPVTLSAQGLKSVVEETEKVKNDPNNIKLAFARAVQQNRMIEKMGLTGHFYPQRLKNLTKI